MCVLYILYIYVYMLDPGFKGGKYLRHSKNGVASGLERERGGKKTIFAYISMYICTMYI